MANGYVIGIDIGGTNIKAGVIDLAGNVICKKLDIPTLPENTLNETIDRLYDEVTIMIKEAHIKETDLIGIGVGVPGLLDLSRELLMKLPNIPKWEGHNLKNRLRNLFNLNVELENDANALTVGEYLFGNGRKYKNLICLTLGTGIGGGVIIDGKLLTGADGVAGELGHITVVPEGDDYKCGCGNIGCVEAYAGTYGIIKRAKKGKGISKYPKSSLTEFCQPDKKLTPKIIYEYAEKGDEYAMYIFKEIGHYLGIAIADLLNIFNPEVIILGGALSKASKFFLPAIKEEVRKRAFKIPVDRVDILTSSLDEDAGLIGAASVFVMKNKQLFTKKGQTPIIIPEQEKIVLALHIGASGTTAALINIIKNDKPEIIEKTHRIDQGKNRNEIINIAKTQAQSVIKKHNIPTYKITGTGISVAGPVDSEHKRIIATPNLPFGEADVGAIFTDNLPHPIFVENDANALAVAELEFGRGVHCKNFISIALCTGIGGGIIINENIYKGSQWSAGEIGHQSINISLETESELCSCGRRGCLECYASGLAIVKKMKQWIDGGKETVLKSKKDTLTYMDIYEAALNKSDDLSIHIFKDMGKYLAVGIANILKIMAPEKIIMTGRLSIAYKPLISRTLQNELRNMNIYPLPLIEVTTFQDDADLIGATASFLYQLEREFGCVVM